jgi:signal transduction histidine kinase
MRAPVLNREPADAAAQRRASPRGLKARIPSPRFELRFEPGRGDRRTGSVVDQVVPLATALRWATVALGLLLLTTSDRQPRVLSLAAGAMLVGNTVWRTLRPLRLDRESRPALAFLALDIAIITAAILLSGHADSPFLLTPIPTLTLAGFGWGNEVGVPAALMPAVGVLLADLASHSPHRLIDEGLQAGLAFLASAAIGGLARRLSLEAAARQQETLDQMTRMATANDLLLALHRVVQTLPASLDLGDVVTSAQRRFRESFDYTAAAVLVKDDATGGWRAEWAEGVRLAAMLDEQSLPEAALPVVAGDIPAVVQDLFRTNLSGCSPSARSGLYASLRTPRDTVVGLVVIEHADPDRYTERDALLLEEMARPLALAIDNALWFARLRVLAAEAERARIARDLHDRLAQSLGYIAFELERLTAVYAPAPQIEALHEVVRDVVVELRETLHELRATITETVTLADIVRGRLGRLEDRTGMDTHLVVQEAGRRLPVPVEQEVWRIAQEALANVERHSGAREVWVTWTVNGGRARLEVRDDGRGFHARDVPEGRFGIVGMRERASAIGAQLTIDGEFGAGTRVLVRLEVPR